MTAPAPRTSVSSERYPPPPLSTPRVSRATYQHPQVLNGLSTKGFFQPELVTEIEECLRDRAPKDLRLPSPGAAQAKRKADPRHVEQRIEEDRERHKRLRETMWAVPAGEGDPPEWEKQWEETSDWGSDDDTLAREEAEMRGGEWGFYCEHSKG